MGLLDLRVGASQGSPISLQRLEPSPIESPVDLEKQPSDLPQLASTSRYSKIGLSGSGHGAVYYLSRLQRYSSYAFTIFTAFHITSTSFIPLITQSVPASEPHLLLTRPYYQSPLMEPILVTVPLLTHIASGVALRIYRRNKSLIRHGASNLPLLKRLSSSIHAWPLISYISISGYVLTPLVLGHVFVNRILPFWVEGGSSGIGLGFVSHGFAKHPLLSWSGYIALVGVTSGHMVWGWAKWKGWMPVGIEELGSRGRKGKRRWWAINGAAAIVAAMWMAGGLGIVGRGGIGSGWIAKGWDELYAKAPLLRL